MRRTHRLLAALVAVVLTLTPLSAARGSDGPTEIATAAELAAISGSGSYVLTENIMLTKSWTPLAPFSGTLDGVGHTISGLDDALFSKLTGAVVRNLTLAVDISKESDSDAEQKAAGLALEMSGGLLENVHVGGSIYLRARRQTMGGLVAFLDYGVLEGCSSDVALRSAGAYGGGTVSYIGGLVACTWWNNTNKPGAIRNCAMTGSITAEGAGVLRVGGIVGHISSVDNAAAPTNGIARCTMTGTIAAQSAERAYIGGIAGYTEDQTHITDCLVSGAVLTAAVTADAQVGGIGGYIKKNTRIYHSLSVGGTYAAAASDAGRSGYAGGIVGGEDGDASIAHILYALSLDNTLTADVAGGIAGFRYGNSNISDSYYYPEDGLPLSGYDADHRPTASRAGALTPEALRDPATYGDDFAAHWVIPTGGSPVLLWTALSVPGGTVIADAAAQGADGDGAESAGYIGMVGTDLFPTLAAAFAAAREGDTILTVNLSDYTFISGGYAVTLDTAGGGIISLLRAADGSLTLPTATRAGYTLQGWQAADGTHHPAGETVLLDGDAVFTARWQAVSTGGGDTPPPAPKPEVVVLEHADGSTTETTTTTTTQNGAVTTHVTETTKKPDGTTSATESTCVTSPDGGTVTTDRTTVVTDHAGAVVETAVTHSSATTDPATGIVTATGATTTTASGGAVQTATFARVQLALPSSVPLSGELCAALVAAVKAAEQTAGGAAESVLTLTAADGGAVTLPAGVVAAVAGETAASLCIDSDAGQIELSTAALETLAAAGAERIEFCVQRATADSLPQAQSAAAASGTAFVIEITAVGADGARSPLHSLGGGEQLVRLPYSPAPGADVDDLVVYYTDEDGVSEKIGGRYNAATGRMEFCTNHNSLYLIVSEAAARFFDVGLGSWYYAAVNDVVGRGLMRGTGAETFAPLGGLSRAMLVALLYRMEGEPEAGKPGFPDTADGLWYSPAVAWAEDCGLVLGFEDGTFRPDAAITREQAVTVLYRYAAHRGLATDGTANLTGYADAEQLTPGMADAVRWAVSQGLLRGTSDTTLTPAGTASRAEGAAILSRFRALEGVYASRG